MKIDLLIANVEKNLDNYSSEELNEILTICREFLKNGQVPLLNSQIPYCYDPDGGNICPYLDNENGQYKCSYRGSGAVQGSIPESCPLGFKAELTQTGSRNYSPNQLVPVQRKPIITPINTRSRTFINEPGSGGSSSMFYQDDEFRFPQVKATKVTDKDHLLRGYGDELQPQNAHPTDPALVASNDYKTDLQRYPFRLDKCPKCGQPGLHLIDQRQPSFDKIWECNYCRSWFVETYMKDLPNPRNPPEKGQMDILVRNPGIGNTSGGFQETVLVDYEDAVKLGMEIAERQALENMPKMMMQNPQDHPVEIPSWSPKGIQKQYDEKVRWKVILDDRVCDKCLAKSENIYEFHEIRDEIPLHPNCRCRLEPLVEVSKAAIADYTLDDYQREKYPPNQNITYRPGSGGSIGIDGLGQGEKPEYCPFCFSTKIHLIEDSLGGPVALAWSCENCAQVWTNRVNSYNNVKPPLASPLSVPVLDPNVKSIHEFSEKKDFSKEFKEYFQETYDNSEIKNFQKYLLTCRTLEDIEKAFMDFFTSPEEIEICKSFFLEKVSGDKKSYDKTYKRKIKNFNY